METTVFMIAVSCVCLIVGIYFFFVRPRPEENPGEPQ